MKKLVGILAVAALTFLFAFQARSMDIGAPLFRETLLSPPDSFWQLTNGPLGGGLTALAVGGSGEIFVGTDGGGVFRSSDNGENWELTGLSAAQITMLGVNINGDIFAGTTYQGLLLRSEDGGKSWANAGLPSSSDITSVAFNQNGHVFASTWAQGVFRSSDFGNSWANIGLVGYTVAHLLIDEQGVIFASSEEGVFRSADGGANWENTGLNGIYPVTLGINGEGHLFVGTVTGLYYSTDGGGHWGLLGFSGTDVGLLGINSSGHIFISSESGVFRSVDDGGEWENLGFPASYYIFGGFAINSQGHIFIAANDESYNGMAWRSEDNGDTWAGFNAGLAGAHLHDLAVSESNLLVASHFDGISISLDQGQNWEKKRSIVEQMQVSPFQLAAKDPGYIFAIGYQWAPLGLYRSVDRGDNWEKLEISAGFYPRGVYLDESGRLFATGWNSNTGGYGIWNSTDNGDTWILLNPNITNEHIRAITSHTGGSIFAGGAEGTVFRSQDNGVNWTALSITDKEITAIATHGQDIVLAGTRSGTIFRSADKGDSWVLTANLNSGVRQILSYSEEAIFAATEDRGVFLSADGGANWYPFNQGLANLRVQGLAADSGGALFAATDGNGVFRGWGLISSTKGLQAAGQAPFALGQSYPNPFTSATRIGFTLEERSQVRLDIFDMNGKKVATLVDELLYPGSYEAALNGSKLPPGVYLYRLNANGFTVTKRCVLTK